MFRFYGGDMRKLMTIQQVVDELDGAVSKSTIWRQCRSGRIPAIQVGHRWLIPSSWLRQQGRLPLDAEVN